MKTFFTLRTLRRAVALVTIPTVSYLAYDIYQQRTPSKQLPWDDSKKSLVILGSGWAATSILQDLDTQNYNVIVISPRNYFLFTPLLPSTTVGTVELRSIIMPIRYLLRHKLRKVQFVEATCTDIDPVNKTIMVQDESEVRGEVTNTRIKYDFLVVASGAQNATFGIKGVEEYACFLKETWDARKIRQKLMDCLETACFPGQSDSEISRILHMVVVGGGPTGVEYAAELHDFLHDDLSTWYPEITSKIKITLVEALPHVLPMFSSELIKYTEAQFAKDKIEIMNNTMVKEIREKEIVVRHKNGEEVVVPYGLLVWATGNTARPHVAGLIRKLDPSVQNQRRGLVVDEYMAVKGAKGIFALGDCTATKFPPTAQVATRQGAFLAKYFNNLGQMAEDVQEQYANGELGSQLSGSYPSFEYSHVGTLAYIGSDKAIADLPGGVHLGGILTFFFWRSVYLSNLFTVRNRVLVVADWIKMRTFGRDIARE